MYCGICGRENPASAAFCGNCGTAVPDRKPWKVQVPEKKRKPLKKPVRILRNTLAVLLILFFALLAQAGAFGFLSEEHAVNSCMSLFCSVTESLEIAADESWGREPDYSVTYSIIGKEQLLGQALEDVREENPDRRIRGATNVKLLVVEHNDGQQQTQICTVALLRQGLTWCVDLGKSELF